jgi:hypothetical protein
MRTAVELLSNSSDDIESASRWSQTLVRANMDPVLSSVGTLIAQYSYAGRYHHAIDLAERYLDFDWRAAGQEIQGTDSFMKTVSFGDGYWGLGIAYTAPPLRLKKRGLGEPDVLVVWGPLMVGGTYYAATGSITWAVLLASLPYGLLCTTVLMGKHIDKIPWDARDGTRTLPVLLGDRAARVVTQAMMVAFYALVALLVGVGTFPIAALLVVFAVPTLVKIWPAFSQPKPAQPPAGFPIWPLWYAALAFVHTRRAGGLLVLGLVLGVILGW